MLSANTHSMPLKSVRFKSSGRGFVWRPLGRFFQRLFKGRARMARLPDELRGDLALPQAVPENRVEAFWDGKQGSNARDLPL